MNLRGAFPRTFAFFVLCSVHSANAQLPAPQTPPSLRAVPTNLDLLAGEIGSAPAGWLTPAAKSGFTARLVEQGPTAVARGVVLRYEGKEPPSATGDLRQRIAGKDYRNKVVRLRADVRVEPGEKVFTNLFVRDERAPGSPLTAFVDEGFRITRGDWETCEVSAAIDEDAEAVIFGMRLHGAGTAAIANVSFEVLGPVEPVRERARPLSARGLANLTAFARLIGYVRHFHPSDQAERANWMAVAIAGVETAESAGDATDLARRLEALFRPVAPTVRVFPANQPVPRSDADARAGARELISWKHTGFYSGERVLTSLLPGGALPQPFGADLGAGVMAVVPLSLFVDDKGTLPHVPMPPRPWYRHDPNDRAVRLADVVMAWNIFQHFYPYFDVVRTDWPKVLSDALTSAAVAPDAAQFGTTLRHMVAALHDGHGTVFPGEVASLSEVGLLPISVRWINEGLIVTSVNAALAPGVARGDAVMAINGQPVAEWRRHYADLLSAATPQYFLERLRAELAVGRLAERVVLDLEPFGSRGTRRRVTLERQKVQGMPEQLPDETRPDKLVELRPGVVYIDLTRLESDKEWLAALPKLQQASTVIFDVRGYPVIGEDFLRYLFEKPFTSAQFRRPIITQPDGKGRTFTENHWNMTPLAPYVTARKIFLTGGRAISYAESIMGIVEHYRLGEIVGGPTAGTNGNAIMTDLPGGYRLIWTGMQVLKHDGSQHHGVGILPTVPASRTRAGIAAGRDEVLERALTLLGTSASLDLNSMAGRRN